METILYKPLFINPQAYYVFPNINGRLEPKTGSGKEPAIFVGNIEVKTIAHGDIGKKQYFYNTNEIDLSAFSNSLVRISLYTSRGNVVLGEWNLDVVEGESEDYIDPEVLASLVAVCICDGKSNNDPDRAVIKNLVDPDNPFIISNAAFKLNSGYGKYIEDFTDWIIYPNIKVTDSVITTDGNFKSSWFIYKHSSESKINEMNIKVSGIPKGGKILYYYISDETANLPIAYTIPKDGIYHLPESKINNNRASVGFTVESRYDWNNIRIEQIPSFEGAFVTDGKDDMITSTKTAQEMLSGSNEITVVSMVHQITTPNNNNYTNIIRYDPNTQGLTNIVQKDLGVGKAGIYGYSANLSNSSISVINNILGDKSDYIVYDAYTSSNISAKYSVQGWMNKSNSHSEISSVAWYWTIIANKVLTTDQINQVISYFNLDKHVKPDIIYDTIRQGITNENHASFNDELTDFSGNGHNMKIYNSAWNKESGINDEGAWQTDGVTDYGQYVGDLELKDYTIAVDRAYVEAKPSQISIMSNVVDDSTNTPFLMEHMGINKILAPHSFGKYTALSELNINRFISYQSTYKYNRNNLDRGTSTNTGSGLTIGRRGGVASQYANIALWSLLLFPYSLSEFLLERQLKRYKLGTLYPDMIEWRPIAKSNIPYKQIDYFIKRSGAYVRLNPGDYFQSTEDIIVRVTPIRDWQLDVVSSIKVNGKNEVISVNSSYAQTAPIHIDKSPQKIDITIDEYIRYEDIVQPYPAIINLKQDGKTITWGDKLKVGSDIVFAGSANLLPELYTVSETRYNGVTLYPNTIIKVEKSMVFDNARTYLKANEPSCILSPNRLRIPNSSYKILGYIPDLTGKGNRGVINNSAYAGMSGANGYKYDWNTYTSYIAGVKPTDNAFKVNLTAEASTTALFGTPVFTVGSKSHYFRFKISGLINNQKIQIDYPKGSDDTVITSDKFGNGEYSTKDYTVGEVKRLNFYVINAVKGEPISVSIEQLPEYESSFCLDGVDDFVTIPTLAHGGKQVLMKVNLQSYNRYLYDQRNNWNQYLAIVSAGNSIAYEYSNKGGKTYIDGILNEHIIDKDLLNITHNITATNSGNGKSYSPNIGTPFARGNFAQMALFDFMLFPEISSENEIKELNDIIGIEGNTDDLLTKINI